MDTLVHNFRQDMRITMDEQRGALRDVQHHGQVTFQGGPMDDFWKRILTDRAPTTEAFWTEELERVLERGFLEQARAHPTTQNMNTWQAMKTVKQDVSTPNKRRAYRDFLLNIYRDWYEEDPTRYAGFMAIGDSLYSQIFENTITDIAVVETFGELPYDDPDLNEMLQLLEEDHVSANPTTASGSSSSSPMPRTDSFEVGEGEWLNLEPIPLLHMDMDALDFDDLNKAVRFSPKELVSLAPKITDSSNMTQILADFKGSVSNEGMQAIQRSIIVTINRKSRLRRSVPGSALLPEAEPPMPLGTDPSPGAQTIRRKIWLFKGKLERGEYGTPAVSKLIARQAYIEYLCYPFLRLAKASPAIKGFWALRWNVLTNETLIRLKIVDTLRSLPPAKLTIKRNAKMSFTIKLGKGKGKGKGSRGVDALSNVVTIPHTS